MTVRTVSRAATHGETVRCLFAIELSTMSWVVAFNTPLSEKISRHARHERKEKRHGNKEEGAGKVRTCHPQNSK